jgi:hypothetical protein
MKRQIVFRALIGVGLAAVVLSGAWRQAAAENAAAEKAEEGAPVTAPYAGVTEDPKVITGEVQKIDRGEQTLTLTNGEQVTLRSDTTIMKDGTAISFSELQEGDQVRASFPTPLAEWPGAQFVPRDSATELTVTSP